MDIVSARHSGSYTIPFLFGGKTIVSVQQMLARLSAIYPEEIRELKADYIRRTNEAKDDYVSFLASICVLKARLEILARRAAASYQK